MSTPAHAPVSEKAVPCIARQAILAADEKVVGYELFFREGPGENRFTSDSERATSTTIDALNMMGLDVLCDGYPAFVNSTREMLLTEYFALLPPRDVVVEIQEQVLVDDDVRRACERLKRDGYSIALDNFVPGDEREALVQFADFIKVDIRAIPPAENGSLAARYASELPDGGAKSGKPRGLSGGEEERFHLLPGIFLPASGKYTGAADSRAANQLRPPARRGIKARCRFCRS
jgi:hypothetical protein